MVHRVLIATCFDNGPLIVKHGVTMRKHGVTMSTLCTMFHHTNNGPTG